METDIDVRRIFGVALSRAVLVDVRAGDLGEPGHVSHGSELVDVAVSLSRVDHEGADEQHSGRRQQAVCDPPAAARWVRLPNTIGASDLCGRHGALHRGLERDAHALRAHLHAYCGSVAFRAETISTGREGNVAQRAPWEELRDEQASLHEREV